MSNKTLVPQTEPAVTEGNTAVQPKKASRLRLWLRRILHDARTPARLLFLMGPWAAYLCVEYLNENDPFSALNGTQLLFSSLWYYLIFWVARMVAGRPKAGARIAMILCFALGLANHYVLEFRGRIIFPIDLMTLGTAANVATSYDYTPDKNVWIAAGILAIYLLLLALPPQQVRERQKLKKVTVVGSWAAISVFLYAFFCTPLLPTVGIWAQQWKTQANGFLLNFMTALRYSFVSAPDGYSIDAAQNVTDGTTDSAAGWAAADAEPPENLLVIMNESFADLQSSFPNLELTEDPLPFYHSLTKNTVKGMMVSPVTGGGTANVEFEYLTGDSLAFLPSSTVAYQLYCYEGMPTLVSQMSALGYHTVSFHPYLSSGWNRTSVYRWMGFDRQMFKEDVVDPQYIRNYVSDASDYEQLYRLTNETDGPLFLFNVTMQNHSGYAQGWNNLERSVELAGSSQGASAVAAQYFSLIKESDNAIQQLIEHYQNSDERTMIVFFGDHQPPLGNDFYEKLYGKKLDDRTTEEVFQQYEVPFFIWANYDIPEQDNVTISSNLLGTLTMELAGVPLTDYEQLHAKLLDTLPVNTTIGFERPDGTLLSDTDESALSQSEEQLYNNYRIMAYNHLFDSKNQPEGYFGPYPDAEN